MDVTLLLLLIITLMAKIVAFIKEMVLANYYGTSMISDAYVIALTVPVLLSTLLSTGLSSGFIPIYDKIKSTEGKEKSANFAGRVLGALIVVSLILVILYYIFDTHIITVMSMNLSNEERRLVRVFTKICIFSIGFSCATYFAVVLLQANNRITMSGVISVPLNISIIIFIFISYQFHNALFLPIGYLVGSIIQFGMVAGVLVKSGLWVTPLFSIKDNNVKKFISSIGILLIGSSVNQMNVIIDKIVASGVMSGGVAALEYGNRIIDLVSGIFIISIVTVQFPMMVRTSENNLKFRECINAGIKNMIIFLVPISVYMVAFSQQIVSLIYERGAFDEKATFMTGQVVLGYGLGVLPIGLREIFSKVSYACSDLKTPTINAVIGMALNIVLDLILPRFIGILGLSLATSVAAFVTAIIIFSKIRNYVGTFFIMNKKKYIVYFFFEIIAIALSKGVCIYGIQEWEETRAFVVCSIMFVLLSGGAILISKLLTFKEIVMIIKNHI